MNWKPDGLEQLFFCAVSPLKNDPTKTHTPLHHKSCETKIPTSQVELTWPKLEIWKCHTNRSNRKATYIFTHSFGGGGFLWPPCYGSALFPGRVSNPPVASSPGLQQTLNLDPETQRDPDAEGDNLSCFETGGSH